MSASVESLRRRRDDAEDGPDGQEQGVDGCGQSGEAGAQEFGLFVVRAASVVGGSQEDEVVLFVDFIEEAPGPNPVSPRRGIPVLEPFNVGTGMWFLSEAGVDRFPKLLVETAEAGPGELRQILTEACRLEDPIPTQSTCPSSVSPAGNLS